MQGNLSYMSSTTYIYFNLSQFYLLSRIQSVYNSEKEKLKHNKQNPVEAEAVVFRRRL